MGLCGDINLDGSVECCRELCSCRAGDVAFEDGEGVIDVEWWKSLGYVLVKRIELLEYSKLH